MTEFIRARRDFALDHGADIVFASNLPPAAGMSSSSALVVGVFLCLAAVNDLHHHFSTSEDLAVYLAGVETGVGTHGGSEDHTALLCCRPDTLSVYSFCPTQCESTLPLPNDTVFALAASGVTAEKAGAAQDYYNHLAATADAAAAAWRDAGARAASPFGAGFGGSVWALVEKSSAPAMLAEWQARYRREFPLRQGTFFLSGAGPAAGPLFSRSRL